jgi:hypothetical protein
MSGRRLLIVSQLLGGLPAILLVIGFGPPPPKGPGLFVWLFALVVIGWFGAAVVYSLIMAFKARRGS